MHKIQEVILKRRSVGPAERAFFEPLSRDPLQLFRRPDAIPDMGVGSRLLADAIRRKLRVGVFGDYDVDGISSAAILIRFMRAHGVPVEYRLASRIAGYGFNKHAAAELSDRSDLLIVADCGTTDEPSCQIVQAAGIPLIIIDHHTVPSDPTRHPSDALINPKREDVLWPSSEDPFLGLCTAGLVWTLVWRTATILGEDPPLDLLWLAALGTVADRVPLRWESRLLVRMGLDEIQREFPLPLRAMMIASGKSEEFTAKTIGWTIAPMINAAGRMGAPEPALEMLLATTWIRATSAAEKLMEINLRRRELQGAAIDAIQGRGSRDGTPVHIHEFEHVIIAAGSWGAGISGILAGKLTTEYHRPTFVLSLNKAGGGSGSARTFGGANVYDALSSVSQRAPGVLKRWGGHRFASGFTIEPGRLDAFVEALSEWVPQHVPVEMVPHDIALKPRLIRSRGVALARRIDALAPFGQDFARPAVKLPGATVKWRKIIGQDRNHLKLTLRCGAETILWRRVAEWPKERVRAGVRINVVGEMGLGEWGEKEFVEVTSADIELV